MNNLTFRFIAVAVICGVISACSRQAVTAEYNVIPLPRDIKDGTGGDFLLDSSAVICFQPQDSVLGNEAALLSEYISVLTGNTLAVVASEQPEGAIELMLDSARLEPEAYVMTVGSDRITITGGSPAGVFYGIQTLRKSIPPSEGKQDVRFPSVTISDSPRFAYRGAHLDASRHFFPVDSVKVFIDILALHNINRFHWHITDDQGWRIEIKKHPRLAEEGSVRNGTCVGHDMSTSDSVPYGGFYTQDDAREIVEYAAARHITVIPEIDMPGHMLGALKVYPELGCTGGPYEVWQRWGVSEDVLCAGNDSVLGFIDDVLGEIIDIFPSEYIHVGGDECPKARWKNCPKCQARARELGLKATAEWSVEEQLQSYLIRHAAEFLASHGRRMIGWDETLEGGLAPGAVVMSWRDENGGKTAARLGHDAVMTPTSHMYFDYYQTLDRGGDEPDAAGGYIPVEKVYGFNPVPASLTDEEKAHIIGVQANLWTEYIPTFSGVQYAELPRMAALCEVQWCDAASRDYGKFVRRLPRLLAHYRANGYRYARHVYNVSGSLVPRTAEHDIRVTLTTVDDADIFYTLDGSTPTGESLRYGGPFSLDSSCTVRAVAIRPDMTSDVFIDSVNFNKATCCDIVLAADPHRNYAGHGASTLVDGITGTEFYSDGCWLGFQNEDLDAVIDLGATTEVSTVTIRNYVEPGAWIYDTSGIEISLSSDGESFTPVALRDFPVDSAMLRQIRVHRLDFTPRSARFVRVKAGSVRRIPEWHSLAAGYPAFIFVDEIAVD